MPRHLTLGALQPARLAAALVACTLMTACGDPSPPGKALQVSGETRDFSGRMTLVGARETLLLQDKQTAATFRLGGSLLLSGANRPNVGFKVDIIGFSDSAKGMTARSVWTDERGDRAYSDLRATETGPGKKVDGTFTGGTGRYTGVSGDYSFSWQYMTDADDGNVGARVTDLRGSALLSSTSPLSR